ncbi:MAG: hypothetical protein IJ484_08770 [Oscillospiraceae bacterium]|nr:hypothetical protein [Oscillospiraceae bacterium]
MTRPKRARTRRGAALHTLAVLAALFLLVYFGGTLALTPSRYMEITEYNNGMPRGRTVMRWSPPGSFTGVYLRASADGLLAFTLRPELYGWEMADGGYRIADCSDGAPLYCYWLRLEEDAPGGVFCGRVDDPTVNALKLDLYADVDHTELLLSADTEQAEWQDGPGGGRYFILPDEAFVTPFYYYGLVTLYRTDGSTAEQIFY